MADDIVTRLRDKVHYPCSRDFVPNDAPCEACEDREEAADEIERLREQVRWASDRASEWKLETYQLNTEIEWLRAALAIASGMISTMPQYEHQHPESIMEMFLEEARRG